MEKIVIHSPKAPNPIGPYSQAIECNGFIYLSGQIGINPETDHLITESIEAETFQTLKNLQAVLLKCGLDFSHVIKTTIFLSDMSHFSEVNEVYARCFKDHFPARETVAVKTLPKNANVEISMIACR